MGDVKWSAAECSLIHAICFGVRWTPDYFDDWTVIYSDQFKDYIDPSISCERVLNGDGESEVCIRAEVLQAIIFSHASIQKFIELNDLTRIKLIHISNIRIVTQYDQALDIDAAIIDVPFSILNSTIDNGISLRDSRFRFLDLSGCRVPFINAENITVDGNLRADSLKHTRQINLRGAQIRGYLRFNGCILGKETEVGGGSPQSDEEDFAIDLTAAHIDSELFLTDGFEAYKPLNFRRVHVGGHLYCQNNVKLINRLGATLNCNGATIKGSVFLNSNFYSLGRISFAGATIEAQFVCANCHIENTDESGTVHGDALSLRMGRVGRIAMFGEDSPDQGRHRPLRCIGHLDFRGCSFDRVLQLHTIVKIKGDLRLDFARTTTLADRQSSWPEVPHKIGLGGFVYENIHVDSPSEYRDEFVG